MATEQDYLDFTGKVVLVTGSSRGIGEGLVRAFAGRGARCVVNYVLDPQGQNKNDADRVVAELPGAIALQCDVGDSRQVTQLMDAVVSRMGRLDILINNAGVMRDRSLKKITQEDWDTVLRVNLSGTFNCIQQATRILGRDGRIVNISSVSGVLGFFGQANYSASKAAIIALTKVAAREFARQGVTVNAIAPGFVDTEMTRGMPPDVTSQFLAQIPLGRWGTVADIVKPALFLCSQLAEYITGQVLHVNGGFYMG